MLLQVAEVVKSYEGRRVVDSLSLSLRKGERLAILGPSGCGKSTLLRLIQGLLRPDEGEVYFRGRPVSSLTGEALRAFRRRVGLVFQHFNLFNHLTVYENVALALRLQGLAPEVVDARVRAALRLVRLTHCSGRHPRALSGGERQRVAIARVLALGPELILWDEPTSALDPVLAGEVLNVIADLAATRETAMIIVTHEIPFALKVADRMALMEHGRIVEEGAPHELLRAPKSPLGRAFRQLYLTRYGVGEGKVSWPRGRKGEFNSRRDQQRPGELFEAGGGRRKVAYP